jgi:hypothetical protein
MNEQLPKDPVTLDDLKRAVENFTRLKDETSFKGQDGGFLHALDTVEALAVAWRAAFEWRDRIHHRYRAVDVFSNAWEEIDKEYREGMRLIREKLQS